MPGRVVPIIGFLGLALCTFAWLTWVNPPFPIHGDGIRDQLLVRDCTELGRCHLVGAPASVRGTFQGAVWLDLLTAVRVLGGDIGTQVVVVIALNALAVALTFMVAWHWLHPALALPAGFLVARAVAGDQNLASLLVNGSASALFDTVTAAGVLCYGISNRSRFLIVSAFAAALAVNVHIAAATLVPALLLVLALGPRPYRALVGAGALFAAVCLITSGTAWRVNCIAIADRRFLVLLLPAAVLLVLIATKFGPMFRALAVHKRAVLIGCFLVLPFIFASLWLVLIEEHGFEPRYLHPISAPMAVFKAALVWAPFQILAKRHGWLRWIPSVAVLWLLMQQMSGAPAPQDAYALRTWTLTDATRIGLEAGKAGWSFEDLTFHLQARACGELLSGIAVEGPRLKDKPPGDDLQVQVATMAGLPPIANEQAVVPLQRGRFAVLRTVHSWIQPRRIVVCRQSIQTRGAPSCARLPVDVAGRWTPFESGLPEVAGPPGEPSLESRAALTHEHIEVPQPYVTSYRIPVHPLAGQVREFRLADPGVDGCRWEFTNANGLQIRNTLPATHVRVDADNGSEGVLLIEKPFGAPGCPADDRELPYPPCILESQPGETFERLLGGNG